MIKEIPYDPDQFDAGRIIYSFGRWLRNLVAEKGTQQGNNKKLLIALTLEPQTSKQ